MKKTFLFIIVQFILGICIAQEVLNDLEINPQLIEKSFKKPNTHKSASASLGLPFFDDFSVISGYPNQELWQNRNVFINDNYGINPPTIGVATFDAVNEFGYVYATMGTTSAPADTLTSHVIDMHSAEPGSTYLSFYYQPQGLGNAPEKNDSLVLNVISKDSVFRIWYANGTDYESFVKDSLKIKNRNIDTLEFKLVHLKLDNPYFFTDSFQLQFINYANIPSMASRPSDRTNKDHWHIDYVLLDDNRTSGDTIFDDMAMIKPPSYFMKDYSSVPWSHFNEAISKQLSNMKFYVRNNDRITRSMNRIVVNVSDVNEGGIKDFDISQHDFLPFENRTEEWNTTEPPLDWYSSDSAIFEISGKLETADNDPSVNNFAKRRVEFKDYYAYDDGSAEKTYGVDADRAKVAYKYHIFKGDSLKAVDMYFVRNKEEFAGVDKFTLCVWNEYNDMPGDLILAETEKRPIISEHINEFVSIELDTALYVEGTFFIGWKQNSDLLMSVGYDANTIRANRIFFYAQSEWHESDFNGSLMMRPVFGSKQYEQPNKSANIALNIVPNPSQGEISIVDNDGEQMRGVIKVFNYLGQKVYEQNAEAAYTINLSHLNNGMYIVTFFPNNEKPRSTRLIISK